MPDERSKEEDGISFSKLTEEALHTMCRVKMDNGSIARHNLYWVYRNEPYLFGKLVEQGDVSRLTGYLYEISEDLFDKYLLPFLSDGDEPLLINYIRSHYNQLLEDYNKMKRSVKVKEKEQPKKQEEVHKQPIISTEMLYSRKQYFEGREDLYFLFLVMGRKTNLIWEKEKYHGKNTFLWTSSAGGHFVAVCAEKIIKNKHITDMYSTRFVVVKNNIFFSSGICHSFFMLINKNNVIPANQSYLPKLQNAERFWLNDLKRTIFHKNYVRKRKKKSSAYQTVYKSSNGENLYLRIEFVSENNNELFINDCYIAKVEKNLLYNNESLKRALIAPKMPKSKQVVNPKYKSIVVRSNIFHCMHNQHHIVDMDAQMKVYTKSGKVQKIIVPIGFCRNCKIYFIMESVCEKVEQIGNPLCNVITYKNYQKDYKLYESGAFVLNESSLLKKCGYSVSENEGLTQKERQKILANIVDQKILTKQEIIGYLHFFIHTVGEQDRNIMAVSKWKEDLEYITRYKIGTSKILIQKTEMGKNG